MSFFNSELVQNEIKEIQDMQQAIYKDSIGYVAMNSEQRLKHIDAMEVLLEKQRILHTRMEFDPDPQAKEMLNKMRMTANALGIPDGISFNELFKNMEDIIRGMRLSIQTPS